MASFKVGQKIRYTNYGKEKTGTIERIAKNGSGSIFLIFLTDGKFLFPESVIAIVAEGDHIMSGPNEELYGEERQDAIDFVESTLSDAIGEIEDILRRACTKLVLTDAQRTNMEHALRILNGIEVK